MVGKAVTGSDMRAESRAPLPQLRSRAARAIERHARASGAESSAAHGRAVGTVKRAAGGGTDGRARRGRSSTARPVERGGDGRASRGHAGGWWNAPVGREARPVERGAAGRAPAIGSLLLRAPPMAAPSPSSDRIVSSVARCILRDRRGAAKAWCGRSSAPRRVWRSVGGRTRRGRSLLPMRCCRRHCRPCVQAVAADNVIEPGHGSMIRARAGGLRYWL